MDSARKPLGKMHVRGMTCVNSSRPANRGGPNVSGTSVIHCCCCAMRYVLGALGGNEAK